MEKEDINRLEGAVMLYRTAEEVLNKASESIGNQPKEYTYDVWGRQKSTYHLVRDLYIETAQLRHFLEDRIMSLKKTSGL